MEETRKQVWVDSFQTRLFYRLAVYGAVYTLTLFNFLLAWRLLREGTGNLWQQVGATAAENLPLFVAFVFVTPLLGFDAVRFAHRLVGPLSRFQRTVRCIAANEQVRPIQLRQNDYLQEMQADFNDMLTMLERRGAVHLKSVHEGAAATEK